MTSNALNKHLLPARRTSYISKRTGFDEAPFQSSILSLWLLSRSIPFFGVCTTVALFSLWLHPSPTAQPTTMSTVSVVGKSPVALVASETEERVQPGNFLLKDRDVACRESNAHFERISWEAYGKRLNPENPARTEVISAKTLIIESGEIKFPACFYANFPAVFRSTANDPHGQLEALQAQPYDVWFFANAFPLLNAVLDAREKGRLHDRKILFYTDRSFSIPRSHERVQSQVLVSGISVPRATHIDAIFVSSPVYIFKYATRVPALGQRMIWVPSWNGIDASPHVTMTAAQSPPQDVPPEPAYIAGVAHLRLKNSAVSEIPPHAPEEGKDSRLVAIEKDWEPVRQALAGVRNVTLKLAVHGVRSNGHICKGVLNCEEIYPSDPQWPGLEVFYQRSVLAVIPVSSWAPRSHGRVSTSRGLNQLLHVQVLGKAAIITESPDLVYYLTAGKDALVVEPDLAAPVRTAIKKLMKTPALLAAFERNAAKRALSSHGSLVARRFVAIVAALMHGGRDWATPWQPIWKIDWRKLLKVPARELGDVRTYYGKPWVRDAHALYNIT